MSLFPEENLAEGGSRGSYDKSADFRLRLSALLQRLFLVFAIALMATQAPAIDSTQTPLQRFTAGSHVFSPQSGIGCLPYTTWFNRWGYRPIRFDFLAKATKAQDREIEVTLYLAHQRRNSGPVEVKVTKKFVLLSGESLVSGTVLLPLHEECDLWWDISIDGEIDFTLSKNKKSRAYLGTSGAANDWNILMAASSRDKEVESLSGIGGPDLDHVIGAAIARQLTSNFSAEAGEDWLAYSGADVLLFKADEIKALEMKQAKPFLALRQWLMAGGTLWIEQVTNGKEGLAEIEQLLGADGWEFGITEEQGSKPVEGAPGWRYESLAKKASEGKQAIRELSEQILQGDLAGAASQFSEPDSRGWYAMRSYGFGRVMAFSRSPYNAPAWAGQVQKQKLKQIAFSKWKDRNWPTRHGLSSDGASRSFGNWLIPGVGIAPVTEFQFLITLFVLAIGPLNYWLLRRSQRLHLLVLTTPLAALVVTVGLFAYALLSDGLGVMTRARSVTLLNQTSGEAVSWSRVTQYAASAPKGGYAFPADAAVYPILPSWGVLGGQEKASREIVWRDGEQQLVRGWLPTRTAVQHLIVRSHASSKEIRFSSDGKEASNRLGADIELLLVQNEAGDWLHADDVAEGTAARLAPIKKTEAVVKMRLLVSENQPEFPIGAGDEAEEALERFDFLSVSPSRRRRNRNRGEGNLSENLLNKAIARLSGLDGSEALDLPSRSYVAITYESVETPLGLKAAEVERIKETGSFHVTVGRW